MKSGITEEIVKAYSDKRDNLYKELCKLRDEVYEVEANKLINRRKDVYDMHKTSIEFKEILRNYDDTKKQIARGWVQNFNPPLRYTKDYHIVFVLDASGSMGLYINSQNETRWTALIGAVNTFIQSRRQANARDIVSIIEYDHLSHIRCQFKPLQGTDFTSMLSLYGGGTSFAAGLSAAKKVIDGNNHQAYTPVLLFLSDGESKDGEKEMKEICQAHKQNELIVRTLGFCDEGGKQKLEGLAKIGGGQFMHSLNGIQLEKTFKDIATQLEAGST